MTTLQAVELGVLGPLQVRRGRTPVAIPGAKPRAVLTMLGLHGGSVVPADAMVQLLWGDDPPRTAAKALQTHISALRRALGDGVVLTEGAGWTLAGVDVDALRYKTAARMGRDAAASGDTSQAVTRFEEALTLWRGIPELPEGQRGSSEKTRWAEAHAALVEDRADALLVTGRAAEIIGELEAAVADAPLRERRWGQLMLALYRAGRQGDALAAYQRARSLLADQLGVDPGPDLRRLEAALVAQDPALDMPVAQQASSITRAVTFLLTDIEGSTAAWETDADAMAVALARHDEMVEQIVTSRGGRLVKTRGEGDATFSVFERPSAAAAAAIELQEAMAHEPWTLGAPLRIRVAVHTGEVELRDGDYFGRAVNRVARLRSLAAGGQILCSGATAELVIDSLHDDVVLADLGMRQLRNLSRPEHVFELRLESTDDRPQDVASDEPVVRPELPAVLTGPGPFVGRGPELAQLLSAWQAALSGGIGAVLIAGEPGVGKTRLAGEWSRRAYAREAFVLYGRCDEDLGAPYQPFAEALRCLVPCLGAERLRGMRGVEALLPLVPGLIDVVPDLSAPPRADPDTERYALFDAVVALLEGASAGAPVVLILDDLHWAAKPTLLLLRHLLRFGERARVQIVGTYRSTDLDRSHPLAAMLADLHRDGTADRLSLSGLDVNDVSAYVAEAGYDDEELARALASVTGGNPFFLIEALRHVDESGGVWDQSTLPQGIREAVSRRLSRLPVETNKALAAAAVVGSRFAVELVERVVDQDLVDAFDAACKAGIVIEEPGGHYRFNHALIRQSLLAELPSVRRMRLHQRIAATLESEHGADDELLADLAYHYFECAWAGNAAKAVEYCRRAADQAMARLAYEGAADLFDHALHALEEIDDELPDRDAQAAELLVARCEALLAAGDMASAAGAVAQLQEATRDSARLAAWATCFDGELSMLVHPERLDAVEAAVGAAADKLAELGDAAGEAKAHTVRASCLARLGRVGDCEIALDHALTAARRAHEHRRVNAVLAGAPLAALWGPSPVPRAGGRCLDVVRLLRITTDSPAVEATSTRCQAVLEALRGRAGAARRMIESARRTVTELGLRNALLEIEQFAGIVELVVDDAAAAEPHLRRACNGFRRLGLDADTAETAALLGRACLSLDRDDEADELCAESERLAGDAFKAAIAWRTLRAQLLSRRGDHIEARRVAEAAVALAERTDALVDHGDACLALATVLGAAGDVTGMRSAAQRAAELYERKGAAALAEKVQRILGQPGEPPSSPDEAPLVELDNACVRVLRRGEDALEREAWDEFEDLIAADVTIESRRNIVGFTKEDLPPGDWSSRTRRLVENDAMRVRIAVVAVRGQRFALTRLELGTADVGPGAPYDELLHLFGVDEDNRIAVQISFDLDDMDAALAELEALHTQSKGTRSPENIATQLLDRYLRHFANHDWDVMAGMLTEDFSADDRRRVVNGGVRIGRDAEVASVKALAEVGCNRIVSTPVATRGNRLFLARHSYTVGDWTEASPNETIDVVEMSAENQITSHVVFDLDDIDAAFEELETRYLAGEAAPYARVMQRALNLLAEVNRHESGPSVTGTAYADHRRVPFAPGDFGRAVEELWAIVPDARYTVKAVHALDARRTVASLVIEGTDVHGNDLQWARTLMFDADEPRLDVYEEGDIGAALTLFDELHPQRTGLRNAATSSYERMKSCFASLDWEAVADLLTDDITTDDRRRVVNAGVRHGREATLAELSSISDAGAKGVTSHVIATRGERLVLNRGRATGRDQRPDAFHTEVLDVIEVDADGRIVERVVFDPDDIDAAFEELDSRYVAGEAAEHAHTWSVIANTHAAFNRRELPMAPDVVDHRPFVSLERSNPNADVREIWQLTANLRIHIEAVHQLSDLGAVFTLASHGTSHAGFEVEWRLAELMTVDGELIKRAEIWDEADLGVAIAEFDKLSQPVRKPDNAATRWLARYLPHFAARDWDTMAEMLADDICTDDRRRVVNAGVVQSRDVEMASVRAIAEAGADNITSTTVATRGERLVLHRVSFSVPNWPEELNHEVLEILEVTTDGRGSVHIVFDPDDIDAAFEELDARFLAGESAAHAHTWSVVVQAHAAFNRHELPTITPVFVDHRPLEKVDLGDPTVKVRIAREFMPDLRIYIEAIHQLSDVGAVFTQATHGTSRAGFEAEWRVVELETVEGDLISRAEVWDEADLAVALARFEELNRPAVGLQNSASRMDQRFWNYFAARDWAAVAAIVDDEIRIDDRRRVVNAGVRCGRDAHLKDLRAIAEVGAKGTTSTVIASRGEHLALTRVRSSYRELASTDISAEVLCLVEISADNRIVTRVGFDTHDLNAAVTELDARYLAGEAAHHARTWSAISQGFYALNRREVPSITANFADIDHRRIATIGPGSLIEYIRAMFDLPDLTVYVESVHRVTDLGAVVTHMATGTSLGDFAAEWRMIDIFTVDGDLVSRCEIFDEADLDAALARLDELARPAPRLENPATQIWVRLADAFNRRDLDAFLALATTDGSLHDRRRGLQSGLQGPARRKNLQALYEVSPSSWRMDANPIAIRGSRLSLAQAFWVDIDQPDHPIAIELLTVVEVSDEGLLHDAVTFDPDDVDGAFAELEARYLAGEAAPYGHTWSIIAEAHAAFNRRELPAVTPDLVDHRPLVTVEAGDPAPKIRDMWEFTPDLKTFIEAVHRLSDLGAVFTQGSHGTSRTGFEAEWRVIELMTVEGDVINRGELFDEADLDTALAHFNEISSPSQNTG